MPLPRSPHASATMSSRSTVILDVGSTVDQGQENPRAVGTRLSIRGLMRAYDSCRMCWRGGRSCSQSWIDAWQVTFRDSSASVGQQLIGYPEIAPGVRNSNGMACREWPRRRHGMAGFAQSRARGGSHGAVRHSAMGVPAIHVERISRAPGVLSVRGSWAGMRVWDRRQSDSSPEDSTSFRAAGGWCARRRQPGAAGFDPWRHSICMLSPVPDGFETRPHAAR